MEQRNIEEKLNELQRYISLLRLIIEQLRSGEQTRQAPVVKLQMMLDIIERKKPCPSLEFLNKVEKSILNWKSKRRTTREPSPDLITRVNEIEKQLTNLKTSLSKSNTPSTSRSSAQLLRSQQNTKEIIDTISLTSSDEDDDDVEFVSIIAPPASGRNSSFSDVSSNKETSKNDVVKKQEVNEGCRIVKKEEPQELEEGEIADGDSNSDLIVIEVLEENSDVEDNDKVESAKESAIEVKPDVNIDSNNTSSDKVNQEESQLDKSPKITNNSEIHSKKKENDCPTTSEDIPMHVDVPRTVEIEGNQILQGLENTSPQKSREKQNLPESLGKNACSEDVIIVESDIPEAAKCDSETGVQESDKAVVGTDGDSSMVKSDEVSTTDEVMKIGKGASDGVSNTSTEKCSKDDSAEHFQALEIEKDVTDVNQAAEENTLNIETDQGSSEASVTYIETSKDPSVGDDDTVPKNEDEISSCNNLTQNKSNNQVPTENSVRETKTDDSTAIDSHHTILVPIATDESVASKDETISEEATKIIKTEQDTLSTIQDRETAIKVENEIAEILEEVSVEQRGSSFENIAQDEESPANNEIDRNNPEFSQNEGNKIIQSNEEHIELKDNACIASIQKKENPRKTSVDIAEAAEKECNAINWENDFFSENSSDIIIKTETDISKSLTEVVEKAHSSNENSTSIPITEEINDNIDQASENITEISQKSEIEVAKIGQPSTSNVVEPLKEPSATENIQSCSYDDVDKEPSSTEGILLDISDAIEPNKEPSATEDIPRDLVGNVISVDACKISSDVAPGNKSNEDTEKPTKIDNNELLSTTGDISNSQKAAACEEDLNIENSNLVQSKSSPKHINQGQEKPIEEKYKSPKKLQLSDDHKQSTNQEQVGEITLSNEANTVKAVDEGKEDKLNGEGNKIFKEICERRRTLSDISEDEKCIETEDKYMALIDSIDQHLSDISDQANSEDEESALYDIAVSKETLAKSIQKNIKAVQKGAVDNDELRLSDISADEVTETTHCNTLRNEKIRSSKDDGKSDKENKSEKQLSKEGTPPLSEISSSGTISNADSTQELERNEPLPDLKNNSILREAPVLEVISNSEMTDVKTVDTSSQNESPSTKIKTEARQLVSYDSLVNDGILAIHDSDTEDFIRQLDKAISGAESISSKSSSKSSNEALDEELSDHEKEHKSTKKRKRSRRRRRRQSRRKLKDRSPSNQSAESDIEQRSSSLHRNLKRVLPSVIVKSNDGSLSPRHRLSKHRHDSRNSDSKEKSSSPRHHIKHRSTSPREKRSRTPEVRHSKRRSHSPRGRSNRSPISPRRHSKVQSPEIRRDLKGRSPGRGSRDKSSSPHRHKRHRSPLCRDLIDRRRYKSCSPKDSSSSHGSHRHRHRSKSPQSNWHRSDRSPKEKSDKDQSSKESPPRRRRSRRDSKGNSVKYSSSGEESSSSVPTEEFIKLLRAAIDRPKVSADKPPPEPLVIVIDDDDEEDGQINKAVVENKKLKHECPAENDKIKNEAMVDIETEISTVLSKEDLESIPIPQDTSDERKTAVYEGSEIIGTRRLKSSRLEVEQELQSPSIADEPVVSVTSNSTNKITEKSEPELTTAIELFANENKKIADLITEATVPEECCQPLKEPKELKEMEDMLKISEEKSENKEYLDTCELEKVRQKLQTSTSEAKSPIIIDSSSNDGVKKTDKVDEWATKDLDELQEIRVKLERDMGFKIEDLVQYIQNPEQEEVMEESHDFPQEDDVQEVASFPSQYFQPAFEMAAPPQPVPAPVVQPDKQGASHTFNPFFAYHTSQGVFELPTYLGLPPGIKPNDPRFGSRLKLLYNKTRDPRMPQPPISREPLVPQPTEFLGENMQSVEADIRSACLQEISTMPSQMISNITRNQRPVMPTAPKSPHLAQTYKEYKLLKKQAMEAKEAKDARRKAAVEEANKALEADIAKPRVPESAQNLQVPASESVIDKMYRSKKYEADVRPSPGFRIPKKKEEEKSKLVEIEAILSAIDGGDFRDDGNHEDKKKKRRKSSDSRSERSRQRKLSNSSKGEDGKGSILSSDEQGRAGPVRQRKLSNSSKGEDGKGSILSSDEQSRSGQVKQRKLSNSTKGDNGKGSILSSDEDLIVKRKRKEKLVRRISSSSESEDTTIRHQKLSCSSKEAGPSRTRRLSTASKRRNSTADLSDSSSEDIYPSNFEIARASSPFIGSSDESEQGHEQSISQKTSIKNPENEHSQSKTPQSPEKVLSIIKELLEAIFNTTSKTDNLEKALRLLEPFVPSDKLQEYENFVLENSEKTETSAQNENIEEVELKRIPSPKVSNKDTKMQTAPQGNKKVGSRELNNLHRDIQDMFIRDGLLSISSRRMSSIISEERTSLQMGKRKVGNESSDSSGDETRQSVKKIKSVIEDRPYHGDEDVDTDDFEEHQKCKTPEKAKQKKKKLGIPIVRLKRLNAKSAFKNIGNIKTKKTKEDDAALLKPMKVIPFSDNKDKRKSRGRPKSKSKKGEIRNINPDHHLRSKYAENCLLCPEKTSNMVNHYVSAHSDREVFISRLHTKDIEYLTKNPIMATRISGSQKKFAAICIFCDKEIKDTFTSFHDHYSSHTGEYAYECATCDVRKCNKPAMLKHCKDTHNDNKLVRNYTYEKNVTKIKAYICTKCSYIQLHKANVVRHQQIEHRMPAIYESDTLEVVLVEKVDDGDDSSDIIIANEPISAKPDDGEIIFEIETKAVEENNSSEYDNSNSRTDTADSPYQSPETIADTSIAVKAELDPFEDLDRTLGGDTTTPSNETLEPPAVFKDKNSPIMTMIHLPNLSLDVFDKDSESTSSNVNTFLQDSGEQKPDMQKLQEAVEDKQPEVVESTESDHNEQKPDVAKLSESLLSVSNEKSVDGDVPDIKPDTKSELAGGNLDLSILEQMLAKPSDQNLTEVRKESLQTIEKTEIIDLPNDEVSEDVQSRAAPQLNSVKENYTDSDEVSEDFPSPAAPQSNYVKESNTDSDKISEDIPSHSAPQPNSVKESNTDSNESSLLQETKQSKDDDDVIWIDDDEECAQNTSKTLEQIISGPRPDKTEELKKLILKAITNDDEESAEAITIAKKEITENSEQGDDAITVIEVVEEENKDDDDSFPRLEIDLSEQHENDSSEISENRQEVSLDDPTISRIVNMGFQKIADNQYRYYCLIEGCSFLSSSDPEELRIHVRSMHRKQWSGKCNTCKRRVAEAGAKLPMCQEVDHMLKVHIGGEELASPAKRPRLAEEESESTLYTLITRGSAQPSVSPSVGSESVTVICVLKPWIGTTISQKSLALCRNMLEEMLMYCLYKCMGDDCSFATSSKAGITTHFQYHQNTFHGLSNTRRPWLECSYCDYIGTNAKAIIQHVENVHCSSIFQCSKCFYRSCTAYNVLVHHKLFHASEYDNLILTCPGKVKSMTAEMPKICERRAVNVKALSCEVCKEKFYVKDYLQLHMTKIHQKKGNLKKANVGLYACVHCSSETDDLELMREHMANLHPSELPYVCGRIVNKESAIQSTGADFSTINSTCLVHVGGIVDQNLIKKCPVIEAKLHRTEVSFGGQQYLIEPNVVDLTDSEETTSASSSRRSSSTEIAQKCDVRVMNFDELERLLQPTTLIGPTSNVETKKSEERETLYKELQRLIKIATRTTGIHGRRLFVCCIPFCKEAFVNISQWEGHLRFKHPENPLGTRHKCPHCTENFMISEFPSHFAQHKTHRYFCYFCGDTFLRASLAEKHLAAKHSYIQSRIMYLLPKDNDDESTHGVLCDPERFFVLTANNFRTDKDSLMEHMIQILTARYSSKGDKDTSSTCRGGSGSSDQQSSSDKKPPGKSMDEITIDLNSDVLDVSIPVFIKSTQRYVCGYRYCKFRAQDESSFENHFKDHHKSMSKFTCVHCKVELTNVSSFARIRDHMRLHSGLVYMCCMCNGSTHSKMDITRHINVHHKRIDVPIISYIRAETDTKKRIEIIHGKKKIISLTRMHKCLLCTKKCTDNEMTKHLRENHEIVVKYQCDHCSVCDSKEEVEKHVTNSHPNKPFRFRSIFNKLQDDDMIVSKENDVTAEDESSQSSTTSAGTKRQITVGCDGSQTSINSDVKRQKLIENVFHCTSCEFLTDSKDSLNEHIKINHERISPPVIPGPSNEGTPKIPVFTQKPVHSCDDCMFICDNRSDLEAHVKINHLKEKEASNDGSANITINFDNSPSKPEPVINFTVSFDKQVPVSSTSANTPVDVMLDSGSTRSVPEQSKEAPKRSILRLVPLEKLLRPDLIEAIKTPSNSPPAPSSMQGINDEFVDINEAITSDYLQQLLVDDQPKYVGTFMKNQKHTKGFPSNGKQVIVNPYQPSLDEIIFVCYHCRTKLDNIEDLFKHWERIHCSNGSKLNFKYQIMRKVCCVYCDYRASFSDLKSHHFANHAGRPMAISTLSNPLRCSECTFSATSGKDELIQHSANAHKNLLQMVASSKNFIDQKLLDILLRLGSASISFKCKFCNKIYEDKELCLNHVQTAHVAHPSGASFECYTENSLFYGCKHCNILHDHEKSAVQHMRSHTNPYLCSFCPRGFQNYFMLKKHYEIDHKSNETGYKYVDIQQNMYIYKNMLLVFPNGLVMTKGELQNTIYGKMDDFIRLIETVEREELTRYVSSGQV